MGFSFAALASRLDNRNETLSQHGKHRIPRTLFLFLLGVPASVVLLLLLLLVFMVQTPNPTAVASSPTPSPTSVPALNAPTVAPTELPTELLIPTISPAPYTKAPAIPVLYSSPTLTQFCVIADVPYYNRNEEQLQQQIVTQMADCEFLIHLGDIMRGEVACTEARYTNVRDILLTSAVPTFIVVGDNEWNDCGSTESIAEGRAYWNANFFQLENNWNHTFRLVRHDVYPESFYFVHKRTLFFGLNIVGGRVHNSTEWVERLSMEQEWVEQVVQENIPLSASGVIVMAHGRPTYDHRHFFNPMARLIGDSLQNTVPFFYLHGDGHSYIYTENFYDQSNYLRIQHEGGVRDPILRIMSDPDGLGPLVHDAFQHDRQLQFRR
jgi:hypothetical protein